jgi:ferric-dicitrate binding protein FerR (iron transport regulator)
MEGIRHLTGFPVNRWLIGSMVPLMFALALMSAWRAVPVFAETAQVGTAQNAIGTLVVVRPDGIEDTLQGKGSLQLFEGDILRTELASQALIEFRNGIQVALNENTTFTILSRWEKAKGITRIIRLKQGEIWVKTGEGPKPLEVETPVATAAVRETEFNIKVQEGGQSTLTVIHGVVDFGNAFGTWPIRATTFSHGVRGKRCTKPAPADVKRAIAWTEAIMK